MKDVIRPICEVRFLLARLIQNTNAPFPGRSEVAH